VPSGIHNSVSAPTLWNHSQFVKLWTAQSISALGDQFTALAVPLVAALMLRATPGQMGVLTAVEMAPFLLIGLFAGVWVDRVRRRPILITADLGRAFVLLSIPAVVVWGTPSMWLLYTVGLTFGLLTVFFDIAYQAFLPSLVDRRQLVEGNSKLEATRSVAGLVGPSVAGVVIQTLTAPVAILLDALSFVISGGLISLIGSQEHHHHAKSRLPVLTEVREGLGIVFGSPFLRSIAACTGTWNLFSTARSALLILFLNRELGLGPAKIGILFSIGNVAGLLGAIAAGRVAQTVGVGRAIVGAASLGGFAAIPIALASARTAVPLFILSGAFSFFGPVYNINQVSLRQAITPQRVQGRMNATMRFIVSGTMPLGGLLGGALGNAVGLRSAIWVTAIGSLLPFLPVFFSPVRRLRAIPEPVE